MPTHFKNKKLQKSIAKSNDTMNYENTDNFTRSKVNESRKKKKVTKTKYPSKY